MEDTPTEILNTIEKKEYFKTYYQNNKEKYKSKKKFNYTITIDGNTHYFEKKSDILVLITKELI